VNLVTLRGSIADRPVHVAGTLYGKREAPRIVGIEDHIVDVPPSSHMLVVRNADTPGMIGRVGTILGEAGVNISDMDVGKSPSGAAALMVLALDEPISADVVTRLRSEDGVVDAKAIELD
jgi:D-3-phosphoglycerate dehydrogenase